MSGRELARSGLLVTAAFVTSRALGYVRLAVIGQQFGVGADLDAFYAAFRIPDLIYQLVAAGAMASAVVPVMSAVLATDARERAWRVASTVINLMLGTLLVLAVVAFVAAPALMPAITPGFDAELRARTVELTRVMLVSPILLAAGAMATSLLNTQGRFAASVLAPISYNLAIIGGALLLGPSLGVGGLAIAVVAGAACHIGIQLRPLFRTGFRWSPRADLGDPRAREILRLMGPRILGLGATQITFVVVTSLATGVATGAVAAYAFAFALFMLPVGVVGTPMGVVSLPSMSRHLASGELDRYAEIVGRSLRLLLWVMPPIAALTIVLRTEVVEILLGYGRFDDAGVALTASALLFLPLAMVSESLIAILARAFYAWRETRIPVTGAVLAVVVNTTLATLLVGELGLTGIGLGIAVGSWLEVGLLVVILRRRVPSIDLRGVARSGLFGLASATLVGAIAFLVRTAAVPIVGDDPGKVAIVGILVVATGLGAAVHLGIARLLGVSEVLATVGVILDPVRRRLAGRGRPA